MDPDVRHSLGLLVLAAFAGLAALVLRNVGDAGGLALLCALLLGFVGLGRLAWALLRDKA